MNETTDPMPAMSADQVARTLAIAEAAESRKAEDVVALDVRGIASFTDTFIVATGTSDRHVRSIADAIRSALSESGEEALGVEGYEDGRWILLDYGDLIVHVFQRDTRNLYDLERLWSDAEPIELGAGQRPTSYERIQ